MCYLNSNLVKMIYGNVYHNVHHIIILEIYTQTLQIVKRLNYLYKSAVNTKFLQPKHHRIINS